MKKSIFKSLTIAGLGSFCAFTAHSATSLFSDYGQIQNVQNYSSNPFWTPNAPYNQRLPQPVYVQGADLNTDDCIRAVQSLISVQCMARNNCKNTALAEIRPTIMVQLSNLPGNNYVSACSGYIDGAFESYVAQYANNVPNQRVSFPTGTTPNRDASAGANSGLQLKNPYKQTVSKKQAEINERSDELQRLQKQNGSGNEKLTSTAFPTTYADLSFSERIENTREGLEPYKDLNAYKIPDFKSADEWCSEYENSTECREWRDCTEKLMGTVPHLVRAEYDSKRICRVEECDEGWKPNSSKTTCIEDTTPEPGPGPGPGPEPGPSPNDCLDEIMASEPHATKAERDSDGKCKITECETNWHPEPSGLKCIQDGYYYKMAVYSSGRAIPLLRPAMGPHANTQEDNLCYAACGVHTAGDDVNEKVLVPVLGRRFCTPNVNDYMGNISLLTGGVGDDKELPKIMLKDIETDQPIKFSESQKTEIINALRPLVNAGECDGKYYNVEVRIYKYKTSDDSFIGISDKITLDE